MQSSSQPCGKRQLFNPEQHAQQFYFSPAESDTDDDAISIKEGSIIKGWVYHYTLFYLLFDFRRYCSLNLESKVRTITDDYIDTL